MLVISLYFYGSCILNVLGTKECIMNRLDLGRVYVHRLDLNVENAVLLSYALLHSKKIQLRNQHPKKRRRRKTFQETRDDKVSFLASGCFAITVS